MYFSLTMLNFHYYYMRISLVPRESIELFVWLFFPEHMRMVNDAAISKYDNKDLGFPETGMSDES